MPSKADLHIHTIHSDGQLTPGEVIQAAEEKNLAYISITDHDTYAGYEAAAEEATGSTVEVVPGAEITADFNGMESHILAYFFETDTKYLADFLRKQKISRRERIKTIIGMLSKKGIEVDFDEVWAEANGANMGRPHLAKVLIQKGYVGNHKEAFIRYLSNERLGTIDHQYPDYKTVIKTVKEVGGACVLAHPAKFYREEDLMAYVEAGIDGVECVHPSHNYALQKKYSEFCEKHSLLKTGGSDCHDNLQNGYSHFGVVTIAAKHVEKMKRMTEQRKKITDLKN